LLINDPMVLIRIIFLDIIFPLFFIIMGCLLIIGTLREWPSISDPQDGSNFIYGQSFIRRHFGKDILRYWNCLLGIIFISFGKGLAENLYHQLFK
jgi:hypothetical protein